MQIAEKPPFFDFEGHPVDQDREGLVGMDANTQPGQIHIITALKEVLEEGANVEYIRKIIDLHARMYNEWFNGTFVTGNPWQNYPSLRQFTREGEVYLTDAYPSSWKPLNVSSMYTTETHSDEMIEICSQMQFNRERKIQEVDSTNAYIYLSWINFELPRTLSPNMLLNFMYRGIATLPSIFGPIAEEILQKEGQKHIFQQSWFYHFKVWKSQRSDIQTIFEWENIPEESNHYVVKLMNWITAWGKSVFQVENNWKYCPNKIIEKFLEVYWHKKWEYVVQICPLAQPDEDKLLLHEGSPKAWHARSIQVPNEDPMNALLLKLTDFEQDGINNSSAGRESILYVFDNWEWKAYTPEIETNSDEQWRTTTTKFTRVPVDYYTPSNWQSIDTFIQTAFEQNSKLNQTAKNIWEKLYQTIFAGRNLQDAIWEIKERNGWKLPDGLEKTLTNMWVSRKNREFLENIKAEE